MMSILSKTNKTDTAVGKYHAIFNLCKEMNAESMLKQGAWTRWVNALEYLTNTHKKVYRSTPTQSNFLYITLIPGSVVRVYLEDNTHDKYCHIGWKLEENGTWSRIFGVPSCSRNGNKGVMVAIDREETDWLLKFGGFDGYKDIVL